MDVILVKSRRTLDGVSPEPEQAGQVEIPSLIEVTPGAEPTTADGDETGPAERLPLVADGIALPKPILVIDTSGESPVFVNGIPWADIIEDHPIPRDSVGNADRLWPGQILLVERPGNRWRAIMVRGETHDGKVQLSYINWSRGWDDEEPRAKFRYPDMKRIGETSGQSFSIPESVDPDNGD